MQANDQRERDFLRLQRQRLSAVDFEPLTIIGRGAFGEVWHSPRLALALIVDKSQVRTGELIMPMQVRVCKEKADWEDICNEKAQKGRDAAKRSGEQCIHILLAILDSFGRLHPAL